MEVAPGPDDPPSVTPCSILVDTSTDLRAQALAAGLRRVDAILFTHTHADHIFGLDETRRFNAIQQSPIGCYANADTLDGLRQTFSYIFNPPKQRGGGIPELRLFEIVGPFSMAGIEIVPIPVMHGRLSVLGFRVGPFAYLTDCNRIPDSSWPLLTADGGVKTLIIDALREKPHTTHFNIAEALDVVARLGPDRAWFTHVCHDLPHAATNARLPRGVELAYDGLTLDIP